jgi:hypothetical protein
MILVFGLVSMHRAAEAYFPKWAWSYLTHVFNPREVVAKAGVLSDMIIVVHSKFSRSNNDLIDLFWGQIIGSRGFVTVPDCETVESNQHMLFYARVRQMLD